MDCAAKIAPRRPLLKFTPPCIHAANGSRSGASAESSMDEPNVNEPDAMMTSQS